ncbi:class I adenylate-forming enzyme family protein [Nocardioides marmotae]|uniref:AMP-binding protein n=1 Tax=Nocardioides marmotae TaxID=2663857 RepID=A0A6I3J3N7_9ACTN|nr:AMP-binding protein [Nocardioides marmotae]MCR6030002.1 AMP-binding protein [Gordonia jinghuaiqii]MBC9732958.1 AMP-binding protein [Nocardioides marmotae]MTB84072.1 AMP-binding protein [Nocardioides marmotae]MTB93632.1 AMP-binding protein [Nocardioides marmotae]QKD99988.1 AMP-binding protein [Nocardioides marmotae]
MPAPSVPADLADLVAIAARENPDKIAVVEAGGRSATWAGLEDEVGRVATGLSAAGIVAGHRVMLVVGNRLEFVTTYLAVLRAQAVAVPVNPGSTPAEVARMLADCGARMVLADPDTVTTVRAAVADPAVPAPAPRVVVVGGTLQPGERSYDDLRADRARPVPPLQDPDKLAVLLYTSGTSGLPRGAMLTHRALLANIEQVASVSPRMIHGDDVVLGVLPLFHVYGLNAVLGGVLRHRAKLVLVERFDPEGTLDLVEDEACSVLPVAPPVFAHWKGIDGLAERLGPVRLVLSGSAPLAPEVVEEFTDLTGVPVHQGYGLTEAAPVVTSTLCSTGTPARGSVGAPLPGIEVRLVDAAGGVVAGGDPGEIQVRGANLFSGYWPDGADGPGEDGWWGTGDVGILDEAGDLMLVDRVKELVIVSGFNVFPVEVEEVLKDVPGVRDAAVIGVPDETTGEAVVAFLVAGPGADPAAVREAAVERCAALLAAYKRPVRLEVVAELPLTVTGKVQKGRLRQRERRRATDLVD